MRAGNETRTRDPDLGKVVLYQLSYSRNWYPGRDLNFKIFTSDYQNITNKLISLSNGLVTIQIVPNMSHNVIELSVVAYGLKSTKNNLLKSTLELKTQSERRRFQLSEINPKSIILKIRSKNINTTDS